jgi:hypothetical protein
MEKKRNIIQLGEKEREKQGVGKEVYIGVKPL